MRSAKFFIGDGIRPEALTNALNSTNREILVKWHERRLEEYNQLYDAENIPEEWCLPPHGIGSHCKVALYLEDELDINSLVLFKTDRRVQDLNRTLFFLGRTIAPSLNKGGIISTIAENHNGTQALRLFILYKTNFHYPMSIPVGMIIIVTEPKVREMYNGNRILWCKDFMDIQYIDEFACKRIFPTLEWKGSIPAQFQDIIHQPTTKDDTSLIYYLSNRTDKNNAIVEFYKRKGNEHFVMKQYMHALKYYHQAHKLAGNDVDILVNRSVALLKAGWFTLACEDATHALKFEPLHLKAICRKLRALSAMSKYDEALAMAKYFVPHFKKDKTEFQTLLVEENRIHKMQSESKSGKYDIFFLLENVHDKLEDCGEYFGPVKIVDVPGRGRGVVATGIIKSGQLVMASRAFEIIKTSIESKIPLTVTETVEVQRKRVSASNSEQLVDAIIRHLFAEPRTKKEVFTLYAGPELKYLNMELEKDLIHMKISKERVQKIVDYNAFFFSFSGKESSDNEGIGLWLQASYLNHSCVDCNCSWKVFGDFLVIRAFKDILPGEEIIIPYFNPLKNYLIRRLDLEKIGIYCDCRLCRIEKTESKADLQKRAEIMGRCNRQKKFCDSNITIVRRDLETLRRLRPTQKYNLDLINILRELSCYYIAHRKTGKAVEELKLAHSLCSNTCLCETAATLSVNIMWLLLQFDADKHKIRAKKWLEIMRKDLIMSYGTVNVINYIQEFGATVAAMKRYKIEF